jgi:hypothetical protein
MRVFRSALIASFALFAAQVFTGPVIAAAAQAPVPEHYYVQSVATGLNVAAAGSSIAQHRPKGNEDHQQWSLWATGDAYVLEDLAAAGNCLGRSGDQAVVVGCGSAEARWNISSDAGNQYRVKVPGADQYLVTQNSDGVRIGGDGDAARWYLTPLTARTLPSLPDGERTLDQVTFLTTHNAYANGADGGFAPPFANLAPNQARGINQQLADGVRGFMLDIHQTSDGAILCHNSCTLVSRPVALAVDLQRFVDFLNSNPNNFVTVFLEDYVSPQVLRDSLNQVNGIYNVLYRPDQTGVRTQGWPKLSDLRTRNQKLLIFTDHSRAEDESAGLTRDSFGVQYQSEWTVENYWSMGSGMGGSDWSCYSRWSGIPLTRTEPGFRPLYVMNHFRDVPVTATANTDNSKLSDRAQRFCEPAARKKPTFLAVDHYHLGDPAAAVNSLNSYRYPGGAAPIVLASSPGLCVDNNASGTADGNPVQIWGCNSTGAQQWSPVADGTITTAGKCLDVNGGGTVPGTKIQLWQCNGTGAQQWRAGADGTLRNPQSGLCLDDPGASTTWGTQLILWTCNGGVAQGWKAL